MELSELVRIFEMSGWQALGKFANPATGQTEVNLAAARNTIEILQLLREKTRGNLAEAEEKYLAAAIANLQLNYAAEAERAKTAPPPESAAPEKEAPPEKNEPETGHDAPGEPGQPAGEGGRG